MIKTQDIITARDDRSQVLNYDNPLFSCIANKSFYSPEMTTLVSEHWHEELEYLYVIEGSLEYNVNGEIITLSPGEGIFVNSRRIHANISRRGEYCVFYYILIHPSNFCSSSFIEQKYVAPLLGPGSFDYILLRSDDWSKEIVDDIKKLFETPYHDGIEIEILESGFRALKLIFEHKKPDLSYSNASSAYVNTFKDMVTYINDHYMEKISLDDIANAGCVGKTLCAKIFKKFASKTPGDYLIHYRITRSMELLDKNEFNITDIAYQTGFNSASHYTKTFRELIGCTPNKYRAAGLN